MDDLQSQLEQGNSELLQEDPLLVKVLTQDAAGQGSNLVNSLSLCSTAPNRNVSPF